MPSPIYLHPYPVDEHVRACYADPPAAPRSNRRMLAIVTLLILALALAVRSSS